MEQSQGNIANSPPTSEIPQRPIILSPPPLDQNSLNQSFNNLPTSVPQGHANRQQSVGYNLQHEFETLTANLDLDLNSSTRNITQSAPPNQQQQQQQSQLQTTDSQLLTTTADLNTKPAHSVKPTLAAPAASRYGSHLGSDLLGKSTSSLLGDNNPVSPIQKFSSINTQLDSLLNNNISGAKSKTGTNSPFLSNAGLSNRPQSVNDFSNIFNRQDQQQQQSQTFLSFTTQQQSQNQNQNQNQSNFYLDLIVFSNWIENLNPQDNLTMIDYLCSNLPLDILLTFKSKLDLHLQGGSAQNQQLQQLQLLPQFVMSPYSQYDQQLYNDMDKLNIQDDSFKSKHGNSSFRSNHLANLIDKVERPKSADPFVNNTKYGQYQQQSYTQHLYQQQHPLVDRAKSPTSHLYEKTNFLQLAAANSNNTGGNYNQYMPSLSSTSSSLGQANSNNTSTRDDMDLKLGALATINSRVALDSNRKHPHVATPGSTWNNQTHTHLHISPPHHNQMHSGVRNVSNFEESINRSLNSSSVPASMHKSNYSNSHGNNSNNNSGNTNVNSNQNKGTHKKKINSPTSAVSMQQNSTSVNSTTSGNGGANANVNTTATTSSSSSSSMPIEVSSLELLNNIPAWLKLLRLHKYTECLKDVPWKELIELDNDQLESKGVAALGARRKLLKAFDVVKNNLPVV